MPTFEERFEPYHRKLQENTELVRGIFRFAREKGLVTLVDKHNKKPTYCSVGKLEVPNGEMYLGVDLFSSHQLSYRSILSHMRLLHEISEGKIDIPKVYTQMERGTCIVSEDMTRGGLYTIIEEVPTKDHLDPSVLELFRGQDESSLLKTTFNVRAGIRNVRRPVVDLDHLDVAPEYKDRYKEYRILYDDHPLFTLREV